MSSTVPTVALNADAPANAELLIELVTGETIAVPLHGWSPRVYAEGVFKFGFFESDGVFYSAAQVRTIKPR